MRRTATGQLWRDGEGKVGETVSDVMEFVLVTYALLIVQGICGYAMWLACGAYEE